MKGFWGFLKGSLILQFKALPHLMVSPLIGAVRGAFSYTWKEIAKTDAEIAAFQARYVKDLEKSGNR
jgi:hypothetical protein